MALRAVGPCGRWGPAGGGAFAGCNAKVHSETWIDFPLRRAARCWRHCLEQPHLLPHLSLLIRQ